MNFVKISFLFSILIIVIKGVEECLFTEEETTPTTTVNLNLCQYITGVKLNTIAQAKLITIGNFNFTSTDDCCIRCNLNPICDYFFELQYQGGLKSNCAMYYFTDHSLAFIKKLKNGDYNDKKNFNLRFTSGYTNRFFGY
jgi:hypothetical protein